MYKKISIVVPVYNVEKYLSECIESILNQTFKDFELILVDDGSKDSSGYICDDYARKDSRINVIHKKNGGLSDARNVGIKASKGEYLGFVDSDDCIEREMFQKLYEAIEKYEADISICSFGLINDEGKVGEIFFDYENEAIISPILAQEKYFEGYAQSMLYTVAWNKLYKKSLFDNIAYPVGKLHEDEFTTFRLLYKSERIVYIPYCGYLYRCRNESIMDQFNAKRFDLFDSYIYKLQFFKKIGSSDLWIKLFKKTLHMLEEYQYRQKKSGQKELNILVKQYRKKIIEAYSECCITIPCKLKIEVILFEYFPGLYYLIWKKIAKKLG